MVFPRLDLSIKEVVVYKKPDSDFTELGRLSFGRVNTKE